MLGAPPCAQEGVATTPGREEGVPACWDFQQSRKAELHPAACSVPLCAPGCPIQRLCVTAGSANEAFLKALCTEQFTWLPPPHGLPWEQQEELERLFNPLTTTP